jgi:hypothetical protein
MQAARSSAHFVTIDKERTCRPAQKCAPTESIVFGRLDDLRARGAEQVQQLQQSGYRDAQLYDPQKRPCAAFTPSF